MKRSSTSSTLLLPLALAALYVWSSSRALPPVVATHFGADGTANGYMTRTVYVRFMLAFVVVLPWLVNFGMERALAAPGARINLPNRDHWLSPAQRDSTIAYLLRHMRYFGLMLAAFLCCMHWLVLGANAYEPPALDSTRFSTALGAYMLVIVVWIVTLRRHFRRPPA